MSVRQPVETELGVLRGRDCIYLDSVELRDQRSTLVLRGEINGDLCSRRRPGQFVPYALTFRGVLALRMLELDSWPDRPASAFDEVVGSEWVGALGGKVKPAHRHFVVQTYDEVFDMVCSGFAFELPDSVDD